MLALCPNASTPEVGPEPHSAAFQSLSKTLEKKNNLKSLLCTMEKILRNYHVALNPIYANVLI